jgi:ribose-phosphate pyrophosphokinase
VYVTHGVLSGEAATRIGSSALEMLTITNTIAPTQLVNETTNIRLINMAPLIADAMDRISNEKSVSSLFD